MNLQCHPLLAVSSLAIGLLGPALAGAQAPADPVQMRVEVVAPIALCPPTRPRAPLQRWVAYLDGRVIGRFRVYCDRALPLCRQRRYFIDALATLGRHDRLLVESLSGARVERPIQLRPSTLGFSIDGGPVPWPQTVVVCIGRRPRILPPIEGPSLDPSPC